MSRLSLVVIYVADVEASVRFYQLLGLDLQRERHGDGPAHYAAELSDGTVIELYPAPAAGPVTKVRLGLAVSDPAGTAERLAAAGYELRDDVAVDPDRNRITLSGLPWDGVSELPEWMCEEPTPEEKARIAALFDDPSRPVITTGVEYPADSPQGRQIAEWRAAAEWTVLRQWVRETDAGTEERRVAALRRMAAWVEERLEEEE